MNVILRKMLGWLPATLFLLGMMIVTIPDLWCIRRPLDVIRLANPRLRRRTETAWQLCWARRYHRLIFAIMGIVMPVRVRGRVCTGKPCILIVNHRTALDHLLVAQVTRQLGLEHVLWVLKMGMRKAIAVGASAQRAGCAFVARNGDNSDKEQIRQMAHIAREDGASIVIYPEGTRHDGFPREDGDYRYLRDPKRGGLQVLLDELPGYQVVFICLNWRGLRGGKTIWDGDGLIGIHGDVTVWVFPLVSGDTAGSVLDEGWTWMDSLLDPARATEPFEADVSRQ